MANAPKTTAERPDIDYGISDKATEFNPPHVAVVESPRPSGVLRELALARWRSSASQASLPPQRNDEGHH